MTKGVTKWSNKNPGQNDKMPGVFCSPGAGSKETGCPLPTGRETGDGGYAGLLSTVRQEVLEGREAMRPCLYVDANNEINHILPYSMKR